MGILDALFGSSPSVKARRLLRRAFLHVEHATKREDLESALTLLQEASQLDPQNLDVWNELAFVLGHLGRNEDALAAGQNAVNLQPENPKFHNAVLGNRMELAMKAKTKSAGDPILRQVLTECETLIERFPNYAPLHLCRADLLAASGAPEEEWSMALDRACAIYESQKTMGSGGQTTGERLRNVMRNARTRCLDGAQWWRNLPDGCASERSEHTALEGCLATGSSTEAKACDLSVAPQSVVLMPNMKDDGKRPTQSRPSLTYPQHYEQTSRKALGDKCHLKLVQTSAEGGLVALVYRWSASLSEDEADRLDTRARAFIACAIYDAATAAGLACQVGPPHGQRPSWRIEGERTPVSLVNAGFDIADKNCYMQIGVGMVGLDRGRIGGNHWKILESGFMKRFGEIDV